VLPTARPLIAGLAAAALVATAAPASAAVTAPAGCPTVPVSQPFAPWGDTADYVLAPDGAFEADGAGWTLRGGAEAVNAKSRVGAASDRRALRMPAGASATSAPFCVGAEHRTMRFVAHAATQSSLGVDVLYADATGDHAIHLATLGGDGGWAPTDIVPMVVDRIAAERGTTLSVRLRFTPRDNSAWTIDDVYVDPFRNR
jgi:hypothetical protein